MDIQYTGKKKELTLKPPVVAEDTTFDEKGKYIATVSNREGSRLIADNPRCFKEVPEIVPEELTEKYLKGKDPEDLEAISIKRFGVDLDRRDSKSNLIKQMLELQEEKKAEADYSGEKPEIKSKKKPATKKAAEKAE